MKTVPILYTDRCTLSAVTQSDIPVLRQILDDTETQRFLPELCDEFQTEESLKQFVASFDKYLLQDEGVLWGIHKDDTLIGFIAIMDIKTNPTLFYAMHPDYRNIGYMKESLKILIDYVHLKDARIKLQTEVFFDNITSIELLLGIGFRQKNNDKQNYSIEMYLI